LVRDYSPQGWFGTVVGGFLISQKVKVPYSSEWQDVLLREQKNALQAAAERLDQA